MAISKNWLSMVGKKFRRSSDSTDTILPSSIAVSSRFSSQKTDTPKEDNAEVRSTFGASESMGATDSKKKRQMRIWQTLIKIVPRRSSRKSQRDVLSPDGNISPRNSTEKIISYEETTDDIELGDPHVSAPSLSSSVHEREESTKEDATAATRIQAVFRGHRVRQAFRATSSNKKRMGIFQYCLNSTVERSSRSSHTEIISAKNNTFPSSYCTNEAINVKGPINGAASSTPSLNDQDQTQDVAAIKIQAIFRGRRARRASSRKKENARRTRRMSPQNLFNRVRRKFRKASHRDILLSHTNTCARSSTDEAIAAEETAIFENAIGEASSILPISRKKDLTKDDIAAIKIQAFFRGHLARRAFLALRSLVKLQAVFRGVGVRQQARVALHCMHALARLQVRVRARQLLINGEELS